MTAAAPHPSRGSVGRGLTHKMVARRELNDPPFIVSALPDSGTPNFVQKSRLSFFCDQMATIRLSFVEGIDRNNKTNPKFRSLFDSRAAGFLDGSVQPFEILGSPVADRPAAIRRPYLTSENDFSPSPVF